MAARSSTPWAAARTRSARRCSTGCRPRAARRAGTTRCPSWEPDAKGVATREASGEVLNALAAGAARAVGRLGRPGREQQHHDQGRRRRSSRRRIATKDCAPADSYGRTLHFGIREHAMGSILNGIALHGATRPYGGTFLMFSDYMRPAVRLAALMKIAGHLRLDARLDRPRRGRPDPPADRAPGRAAGHPGPVVVRPGDANETAYAWQAILRAHRPARPGSCLTRQNMPVLEGTSAPRASPGAATSSAEASDGDAAGDPHRHRLGAAARRGRPGAAGGRGHRHPGGVDAVPGVVRRRRTRRTATRCCRPR